MASSASSFFFFYQEAYPFGQKNNKNIGEVRNDDANIRVSVRPVCSPSICVVNLVSSFMDGPTGLVGRYTSPRFYSQAHVTVDGGDDEEEGV